MKRFLQHALLVCGLFIFINSSYAQSITPSGALSALSTTYGTASSEITFTFTAAGLGSAEVVTITAPAGFEVSTSGGGVGFGTTTTKTANGGGNIASTTIYVRLSPTANAGTYAANITLVGASASANEATVLSTINPKALTITGASATNKTYDGTTAATVTASPTLNGVLAGDAGNVSIAGGASGVFASATVGTTISVTSNYSLTGSASANYSVTQPAITADITAKALTITGATASNKPYDGGTTATLGGSPALSGVIAADVANVTLNSGAATGTFASANVGTTITVTTSGYAISGTASGNYSLTQPTLSANITAKALTITGVTASNKPYDGTAAATLTGSPALSGVIAGDVANVTLDASGASGTFSDANVGIGKTITTSGYTITGTASGNYSLTQPTTTANITALALTITGATASNKIYDATLLAAVTASPTLNGVLAGDAGNVSIAGGASGTFASKNVATSISVTSNYSLTGSAAGNYTVTQPTLSADITVKSLTISGVTANNKAFDGLTTASLTGSPALQISEAAGAGTTADGKPYSGDAVSVGGSPTANFGSTGPGVGIAVTVSGYTLSGAEAGNYSPTQPTGLTATIYAVEPTAPSTVMTFSSVTNTTLTVGWTVPGAGGGTNRILVVKQGGSPTAPTDGVTYTPNAAFGSGSTTVLGSYVVYVGSGSSVALTGFTTNTSYTFNLYELNGSAGTENYLTSSLLTGTQVTANYPTTQATNVVFTSPTTAALTINWSDGNGAKRIAVIKDATGTFTPANGTTYATSTNFSSGTDLDGGAGKVVCFYNGTTTGRPVTVNNLSANTQYTVEVYEYNGAAAAEQYLTTTDTGNPASRFTLATLPANSATSLVFSSVLSTQYTVSWTASTGVPVSDGYIVLRKIGSSPTGVPTNGGTYSVGNTIGDGTVAYVGSAVTFGETGLTPSTDYFYDVISYSGSGQSTNYKGGPLSNDQVTACLDTAPSNLTFSATGASTTTVNWTRGSGNNVLVIGRSGTASAVTPNPATTYTASTTFGSGTALAVASNDYYVVYQGTGTSVVVTGMNGSTAYNFKVYEYNSTNTCYLLSPATNDVTTTAANTNSTFTAGTGSATIASTVTSQGAATAAFTFTATDLGGDAISTRFTQLVFKPGTGNYPTDWTQIIAGAELYDNATFGGDNGGAAGGHGTAIITANTITIPLISDVNLPDLGSITNSTARIYTLKIWFKTTLGGSLASTIDNKNLAFSILGSDVTAEAGYSSFTPATTTASGGSNDVVTVTATKINTNTTPSTAASANVVLAQEPIYEATDVNNNRDLDVDGAINGPFTVVTSDLTIGPTSAPTNFVLGLADFTGSGFKFLNTGVTTMNVKITPTGLTSTDATSITVSASTNLGSSALSMSSSPLTNGTTGVISGGVATNAVLGFNLQTTGSPLNLTDLVFNSSVSTTGLVSNFQLYSNSSDSFTGATQVATSSSLTFSGMSIGLTGSPTYFFLVCDVASYFPSASPTIQFSLPAGNFTVSTGGKTGSTQTGIIYTLQDITPPAIQSIAIVSPPVTNSWSTTNGTSASTVTFRVTFTEDVFGIQYSGGNKNFTVQTSGPVSYSTVTGAGSSTSNFVDVTVSGINGEGLLRIDFTETDNIIDIPGNPIGGFGFGNGNYSTTFSGNQYYSIVLPAPSNPVAGFTINTEDDIELQTKTTSDLVGPQLPTHYLFMVRESQGSTPFPTITNGVLIPDNQHDLTYPPDGTFGDYASGDGLFTFNTTFSASVFNYTWLFKAGMLYDFAVYPYTKSANYSDDNIAYGTPTFISNHLIGPAATNSTLNSSPSVATIASTYNSAGNMKQVFTFGVTDGKGTITGYEFAPTKFSGLTISKDVIDNAGSWAGIIAGAELFDVSSPTTFVAASSILAGQIQFTGIPASLPGDLGYIAPTNNWIGFVGTKTYGLRIYLNNGAGALTDLKTLAFAVTDASFTYNNGLGTTVDHQQSSKLQVGTATSGAQTIDVTATKLLFTTNLPDKVGVNHIFATPPVVEARDANDNLDLDFTGATISASNGITFSNTPTWSLAKLTFNTFTFNDPGLTQITVSKGGVTSAVSSSPTGPGGQTDVKISAYTSVNQVTGVGIPSTTVPSITTFAPSVAPTAGEQNASSLANISFIVKDDDAVPVAEDDKLPTRISTITIHQNANNGTATGGATFDDWTNSIQGADLSVGGVSLGITPTISSNSIVFSGIANSVAANLGYISDDGSRTYVLKIWLKNPVSTTLRDIFDGEDFVFEITNAADFGLTSVAGNYSSTLTTVSTFDSGNGNNAVDVTASELDFIIPATATQTPAVIQSYDANIDFDSGTGGVQAGVIKARDLNQNLDRGYGQVVTITGGHPSLPDGRTYPINNGTGQSFATGQVTLNSGLQVSSSGNGINNDQTYLIATGGTGPYLTGNSSTFTMTYSGASDVVRKTGFSHPTNIDYATANNQVSDITGSTGTTIETFTLQDGGGSPDSDGANTILDQITFTLQNSTYLQKIALYNNSGNEVAEQVVSGSTVAFTGLALATNKIVATDDNNADFTVKVSFLSSNILDNAVININISSVAAGGVSSGITPGVTTTMPALAAYENAIEVIATHIDFTTMPTTASVFVSFTVVAEARDNYFNLDLDYNGAVSFTTNGNSSNFTVANLPSGSFSGGILNYPVDDPLTLAVDEGFQFTSGNNANTNLTINGGAASTAGSTNAGAIIAGTSPAPADILVQTSFESWLYFDPAFASTPQIDFVNHQEASLNTSSQALALLVLSDGGAPASPFDLTNNPQPGIKTQTVHKDGDGAFTQISSLSVSLTNVARIRTIAIFDNAGNKIDEQAGPLTSPVTFSNLNTFPNLKAPDDGVTKFHIRASFNQTVTDQDQIQLAITNVTYFAGSNFPAATIGGISGGDIFPTTLGVAGGPNYLDVIATSLDFTTQPTNVPPQSAIYAGVYEPVGTDPLTTKAYSWGSTIPYNTLMPVTVAGIVTARDKFANVDTNFNPTSGGITDFAGNPINSGGSPVNGIIDLNGMQYTASGDGTIKGHAVGRKGTGIITTSTSSTAVTGVGTSFTTELFIGSVITDISSPPNLPKVIGTVQSIASNTSLTLTGNAAISLAASPYQVELRSYSPAINTTGTIAVALSATTVNGTGTLFTSDLKVGSLINDANGNFVGTVATITNDILLTLASPAAIAVIGGPSSRYNANSIPCSKVNVLDVAVSYNNTGLPIATITSPPGVSLKGNTTGNKVFGLTFKASAVAGAEPFLKGFYIDFDVPFETATDKTFDAFVIQEVNSAGTFDVTGPTISGSITKKSRGNNTNYDRLYIDLTTKPQSLGNELSKSISFFMYVDVDANVNLSTPPITPYFTDQGWGNTDDQNSIVSNGTATGVFNGLQLSFASTNPPSLLTSKNDLTRPYIAQDNVDPYLSAMTLQFDANVGQFNMAHLNQPNGEIWDRSANVKIADLVFDTSGGQAFATVGTNNTVNPVYKTLNYKVVYDSAGVGKTAGQQVLQYNTVYYVTLPKGNYDAPTQLGTGITDFGLNFFGGISTNSGYYFKTSDNRAPVLNSAKSAFNNTNLGTLTTNFDQRGKAYFLIVPTGSTPTPTSLEVQGLSTYTGATIAAQGYYDITTINADQTVTFPASFSTVPSYDVYVIAENDAYINGASKPQLAAGIYGSATNSFAAGTAGPTLVISSIVSAQSSITPALGTSDFKVCPDAFAVISSPIIISETSGYPFKSASQQHFNILLPLGYEFDQSAAALQSISVQLLSSPPVFPVTQSDWESTSATVSYISNSMLRVFFTNGTALEDNTSDYIVISGLTVKGAAGSLQGPIQCFYGSNTFPSATFDLGTIQLNTQSPVDFVNSYWKLNKELYNKIDRISTPSGAQLNKTVNAIPDNYKENGNNQVQLIPLITAQGDYLGSTFAGSGVTGDVLTLSAVSVGAPFKITINHTDLNGCATSKQQQYVVYDHRNTISNKLGSSFPSPSTLAGTEQAIPNLNWPSASGAIVPKDSLVDNELAGYTMLQLTVDLPSDQVPTDTLSTIFPTPTQYMSGSAWRNWVQTSGIITQGTVKRTGVTHNAWLWDYGRLLNADPTTVVNSTTYNSTGLTYSDVYDYFRPTATTSTGTTYAVTQLKGYNYWNGGSLGKVELTGVYQSTADGSVYNPFRQQVELFVPAVPALEVSSTNAMQPDLADPTKAFNGAAQVTVQQLPPVAQGKIYPGGYPGTSIFCEYGGIITINGYPSATAGVSSGVFRIYNYSTYDFAKVIIPSGLITTQKNSQIVNGINTKFTSELTVNSTLYDQQGVFVGQVQSITNDTQLTLAAGASGAITQNAYHANLNVPIPTSGGAFVDNGNGSMTLDPLQIKNGYDDILVTYTYQDNNSPAFGTGYLVMRVTPNPVTAFKMGSTPAVAGAPGASGFDAFCIGSPISFDAAPSSISPPTVPAITPANSINTYDWQFGDINSGSANASNISTPSHTYNAASTYSVTLGLTSNWGCPSLATTLTPTRGTVDVSYTNTGVLGTTPGLSTGPLRVGENPVPDFSFVGNCTGNAVTFTDASTIPNNTSGNSVARYDWYFDFASNPGAFTTGYNLANTANNFPGVVFVNFGTSSDGHQVGNIYSQSGIYTVQLTSTTNFGCQASASQLLGQLNTIPASVIDFSLNDAGFLPIDISTQGQSQKLLLDGQVDGTYTGKASWQWSSTTQNWATTKSSGTYYPGEISALYTACIDVQIPRPMISFDATVDINAGGLVLQYSSDNKNILDRTKKWETLGADQNGVLIPGIDWYNASALSPNPGSYSYNGVTYAFNQKALGWTGASKVFQPKHALDSPNGDLTQLAQPIIQLRLAFATSSLTPKTGIAVDNIRFGSRTRTIMFENFTSTNGGSDNTLNKNIKADADTISNFVKRNINSTQLVNVNYHVGFLGQDPFNLADPSDPSSRVLYYGVSAVPYAFLDGAHYTGSATTNPNKDLFLNWGQGAYDLQTLKLAKADFIGAAPSTPITVVTQSSVDNSFTADINVIPLLDLKATTTLHVLVLEDTVNIPNPKIDATKVTTGETHFEYVPRQMIPDAVGTKYPAATFKQGTQVHLGPGGSTNLTDKFKWTAAKPFDINKFTIVVFLQDEVTREIYQADLFRNITPPTSVVTAIEPTAENIHVYPNPADGELTIELPSAAKETVSIRMANQLGQFTEFGSFAEGEQKKTIGTGGLTEGVYILQIGSSNSAVRTKVIVLHK